jgi:ABC-type lipoprotein export system ATPase subunit
MSVLRLADVRRTYHIGKANDVFALRGVSIVFEPGELVTIVGPSGSGKTTLLNIAGLLDHADGGEIVVDGEPTSALSDSQRTAVRRRKIGFVFQSFNLLPHLTAEENVALPLRYLDDPGAARDPADLLQEVKLGERLGHRPDQLSGGEQQRVAIARALVGNPPILLCDEPTGELDSETAAGIHDLLLDLRRSGKTLVVVTHNEELARIADRSVHMRDGLITDDGARRAGRGRPSRPNGAKRAPRKGQGQAADERGSSRASKKKPIPKAKAARRSSSAN